MRGARLVGLVDRLSVVPTACCMLMGEKRQVFRACSGERSEDKVTECALAAAAWRCGSVIAACLLVWKCYYCVLGLCSRLWCIVRTSHQLALPLRRGQNDLIMARAVRATEQCSHTVHLRSWMVHIRSRREADAYRSQPGLRVGVR